MPYENVTQLGPLRSSYLVCTCDESETFLNEANCTKAKSIACDVFHTKPYQKNTCHAKRNRRSLQENLSFIPSNFVQHNNRRKARNFI